MPRNERFSLPIPRILHDRSLRLFSVRIADLFRNYLKDAKKVYTNCTAAVLRAKDCVMKTATTVQENAEDILAEAQQINEKRAQEEAMQVQEDDVQEDGASEQEENE